MFRSCFEKESVITKFLAKSKKPFPSLSRPESHNEIHVHWSLFLAVFKNLRKGAFSFVLCPSDRPRGTARLSLEEF